MVKVVTLQVTIIGGIYTEINKGESITREFDSNSLPAILAQLLGEIMLRPNTCTSKEDTLEAIEALKKLAEKAEL